MNYLVLSSLLLATLSGSGWAESDLTATKLDEIYLKLCEISKKLDKPEEKYVNMGGPILFKKKNLEKGKLE